MSRFTVTMLTLMLMTTVAAAECITTCTTDPLMINGGTKCTTVCR